MFILLHGEFSTLRLTLENYKRVGLLSRVGETILFANELKDSRLAERYKELGVTRVIHVSRKILVFFVEKTLLDRKVKGFLQVELEQCST